MKERKIELLSPAGSFDCIQAAINAGADAIYFGVEQLNMRTRSSNPFSISDIKEVSTLCNSSGIRAYITLNTVMYVETNEELLIDNEYILSPKDLCTIGILDQLINSGVDVLKIEGRSKSVDYVYTVTQCYKKALQAIENNTYTAEKIEDWKKKLSTVYNRGFWEGYYLGRKIGEWTAHSGSAATEKKIYLGKGSKYYPKIKVGEFVIESGAIKAGDTLLVCGPACGMVKEKFEKLIVNGIEATEAIRGDKITFPFGTKVTAGDKLYKIIESSHV